MSTVGVVIPCYNYGHYLADSVRSVLSQRGVDLSVLVIDDASSDATPQVATALSIEDPRVQLIRHETNKGHIATYNEGLAWAASADYTVLLSADDLLTPGSLKRAVDLLDTHPRVGMAYGRFLHLQADRRRPKPSAAPGTWTVWRGHDWLDRRCRAGVNSISSPEVVVRSELLSALGGYRDDLPHTADLELWLRIATAADIGFVRADQAYYRLHPASMLHSRFSARLTDLEQRRRAYDVVFEEHGHRVPARERMREQAHRTLAREALRIGCRAYDRGRVEDTPVDDLVAFAAETYPGVEGLLEYQALRYRERLGPRFCRAVNPGLPSAAARRARDWLRWRSIRSRGV